MGWTNSGENHRRLTEAIKQLKESNVFGQIFEIDNNGLKRKRIIVEISAKEKWLDIFNTLSAINVATRRMIETRHHLAKALHTYICLNPELICHEYRFDDLRFTGVKSPDRHFAVALERAFNELVRVGIVKDFFIEKRSDKKWWLSMDIDKNRYVEKKMIYPKTDDLYLECAAEVASTALWTIRRLLECGDQLTKDDLVLLHDLADAAHNLPKLSPSESQVWSLDDLKRDVLRCENLMTKLNSRLRIIEGLTLADRKAIFLQNLQNIVDSSLSRKHQNMV